MAYDKQTAQKQDNIRDYVNDMEDRVESAFNDVQDDIGNININLNNMADFPIDWGENWTKWNSGKLECELYATIDPNVDVHTSFGLPSGLAFISSKQRTAVAVVQRGGGYNNLAVQNKEFNSDGTGINLRSWATSGSAPATITVAIHAKGWWK